MAFPESDPFKILMAQFESRRDPIPGSTDFGLPRLDTAFERAKFTAVVPVKGFSFTSFDSAPAERNFKLDNLAQELEGLPEIYLLHAYLVSHMRKRDQPALARELFLRLWKEESEYLLETLTPRWILSAAISFSVCGENEAQRTAGISFNMFFSLMKLYEFERLFSGHSPESAFGFDKKVSANLPIGLTPFSLKSGDLDLNTMAQLYTISIRDSVVARPCLYLVKMLMDERGSLFSRIFDMKSALTDPHA